jgi:hypothetical protein
MSSLPHLAFCTQLDRGKAILSQIFSLLLYTGYKILVFWITHKQCRCLLLQNIEKKRFSYCFGFKSILRPSNPFVVRFPVTPVTICATCHGLRWAGNRELLQRESNAYFIFIRKLEGKIGHLLVRPVNRSDDNISMNLKEIGHEGWDYIYRMWSIGRLL